MSQTKQASVDAFKQFIRKHPELVKGIKQERKTWKEVFEEWVIFGEDHEIWDGYGIQYTNSRKNKSGQGQSFSKLLGFIKNADLENIEEQINQINGALNNLSELISLFSPNQTQTTQPFANRQQQHIPFQQQPFQQQSSFTAQQPFQFRRD